MTMGVVLRPKFKQVRKLPSMYDGPNKVAAFATFYRTEDGEYKSYITDMGLMDVAMFAMMARDELVVVPKGTKR